MAWPFRRSAPPPAPAERIDVLPSTATDAVASLIQPTPSTRTPGRTIGSLTRHLVAKMSQPALSNHARVAVQQPTPLPNLPADYQPDLAMGKDPAAHPAYTTVGPTAEHGLSESETAWPSEVVHIVQNGDTLDKLAQRYLKDAGRALEIFDLNRDQLTNPHLLPIGAKLRIPVAPGRQLD